MFVSMLALDVSIFYSNKSFIAIWEPLETYTFFLKQFRNTKWYDHNKLFLKKTLMKLIFLNKDDFHNKYNDP